MAPKTLEDHASVVLLGSFNPAIFHPAWLAAKGLVRESEAAAATIEVVHPDVAQFRLEWLHLSVQRERFSASTLDPSKRVSLRDLVIGLFGLLEHTPTRRMGVNRTMQVEFPSDEAYHSLGHMLAPKAPWANIFDEPGMMGIVMQGQRKGPAPGKTNFRVEPSGKYPKNTASFDVNNEYDPPTSGDPTAYFLKQIMAEWDNVMESSARGIETLCERAVACAV